MGKNLGFNVTDPRDNWNDLFYFIKQGWYESLSLCTLCLESVYPALLLQRSALTLKPLTRQVNNIDFVIMAPESWGGIYHNKMQECAIYSSEEETA